MSFPSTDPWVRFTWEFPGPIKDSDRDRFDRVIASGVPADSLVEQAKAYRRLIEAQDSVPADAWVWLDAHIADWSDEPGHSDADVFAAAVRALRAVRGWTQKALADRAGIAVPTVQQIENTPAAHQARRPTRLAVADALGWTIEDMMNLGCTVLR